MPPPPGSDPGTAPPVARSPLLVRGQAIGLTVRTTATTWSFWPLSLQTAGAGGSGVVIGSHSAQLTRTAAAVTDRWASKNFHIAVDARGPRASLNDPLGEPPDQA